MAKYYAFLFALLPFFAISQGNASLSSAEVLSVLQGNYQPATYAASDPIAFPDQIACAVEDQVSADSLRHYIEILSDFGTRHTFSDTLSAQRGIGATRRWVFSQLQAISARNENRLRPAYLHFDITNNTCGDLYDTKNVLAVLPGNDPSDASAVLLMAHMDSRCEGRCDTACLAPGADDNGSGTALVLELARIMSRYTFDHTLIFLLTTGEEQGLLGATAFSDFCVAQGIDIKAVLNNDIVGGVICGETASPPGCSPEGSIDSTRVRLFANPISWLNPHQGFARSLKMFYEEKMRSNVKVPMTIELVDQEDRSGRGGDHIAFRQNNFRNARFSSAHEHGNGNPLGTPGYRDHQHTSNDVIGVDTDNDNEIDSFFVDFNYLARNAVINGSAATFLASGPETPEFTLHDEPTGLRVEITDGKGAAEYRVGIKKTAGVVYDSLYRFSSSSFLLPGQSAGELYYVGVAGLDSNGLMSPFSKDERKFSQSNTAPGTPDNLPYGIDCEALNTPVYQWYRQQSGLQILPPRPNPFQQTTELVILAGTELGTGTPARLEIVDIQGRLIHRQEIHLQGGANSIPYYHRGGGGLYHYYVVVHGQRSPAVKMQVE